jgi:hypothetical protein
LWLLILKTQLFQWPTGDIGQNFEKVKKNGQGALTSQNKQKQILKLLLASPGAPGVLKEPKGPKDYNHDPFLH